MSFKIVFIFLFIVSANTFVEAQSKKRLTLRDSIFIPRNSAFMNYRIQAIDLKSEQLNPQQTNTTQEFSLIVPNTNTFNSKSLLLTPPPLRKFTFDTYDLTRKNEELTRQINGIIPNPFDWRLYNPQRN